MSVTKHASTYAKFLNLLSAVRQMPSLPVLDTVEERLLGLLLSAWESGKQLQVTEVTRMEQGTPERTAFRRIKTLHSKGMLSFVSSEHDHRVKYIVPTKAAEEYFDRLGQCLEQARETSWNRPENGSKHRP